MLKELADGVYVEDCFEGGNVGAILSQKGALLVDTPMLPPDARQWHLSLMQMNVAAIYAIVNTDYHPEHFLGDSTFMPTRTFGHEQSAKPISKYATSTLDQLAEQYRKRDPSLSDEILRTQVVVPQVRVDERVWVHLGNRRVKVLYLEGHTPSSLGVYLPEERILFAGDSVVNDAHPALYHANSLAWLDTLERIREMDVDLIIPGEGAPCGKEAIDPLCDYIVEMRRRTTDLFKKGASRRECVDKVGMLDWFPVPEDRAAEIKRRRRGSVERVYTEIRIALRRKR